MPTLELEKKPQRKSDAAASGVGAQAAGLAELFSPSWRDAANVIMVNERVANLINEILIKEGAADATVIEKGVANVMVMSESLEKENDAVGENSSREASLEEDKLERQDLFVSEKEPRKITKRGRLLAFLQKVTRGFQSVVDSMRAGGATIRLFPQFPSTEYLIPLPSRMESVQHDKDVAEDNWGRDATKICSDWGKVEETLRAAYRRLSQDGRFHESI